MKTLFVAILLLGAGAASCTTPDESSSYGSVSAQTVSLDITGMT